MFWNLISLHDLTIIFYKFMLLCMFLDSRSYFVHLIFACRCPRWWSVNLGLKFLFFSTNLSNTGDMVEMVSWGIESTCYLVKSKETEQAFKVGRCCKMRRVQHPLTFVSWYCSIYRRFLPVFTWIIMSN